MGERRSPAPGISRYALERILTSVRRLPMQEALAWCDKWEKYAVQSGLRLGAPYFWDAARGWIDAQLDGPPAPSSGSTQPDAVRARTGD